MRSNSVLKHLQPMAIGIAIGSIIGLCIPISSIMTTELVKHHMYYYIACILKENINPCVLVACLMMYTIHIGKMFKKLPRLLFLIFMSIICFRIIDNRFSLHHWLSHVFEYVDLYFLKQLFLQGFIQIAASIIIIVLGIILIRRTRRIIPLENDQEVKQESNSRKDTLGNKSIIPEKYMPYIYWVIFVALIGLNLSPALIKAKYAHDLRKAPNIIYIMVDTLRADNLGCYGYSRNTSPNIDKLAGHSIRFSKAISQAPWTTPSVASFMSSRYLHGGGGDSGSLAVPLNVVLMPELLKNRGYETAAMISNPMVGTGSGLQRGYDHYSEMYTKEVKNIQDKQVIPRKVFSKSIEMLKKMKNKRFFLYTHFMGPHSPYAAHKEYNFSENYKGKLSREGVSVENTHMVGDDLKYAMALYDGEIKYTDHYIGLLIAELKKMNLYDNTLIVVLADHGEEFNEHGKMSHGSQLYDESISVPLIMKLPGQKTGSVVKGVFPLIDLLPSVASYINCDISTLGFQGTAVPLKGLRRIRETNIYSDTDIMGSIKKSLRSEKRKFIFDSNTKKSELYNLNSDPGEKRNIAAVSPKIASDFMSLLINEDALINAALNNDISKPLTQAEKQATEESMRALGYLQ